jgi:hypothetical protein
MFGITIRGPLPVVDVDPGSVTSEMPSSTALSG